MRKFVVSIVTACTLWWAGGCIASGPGADPDRLAEDVRAAEQAFAQSMADRDFEAFKSFVSEEAVFFGGATPARGRAAVAAQWAGFFEGDAAPFSWQPETVAVLESGTLALSSGPVFTPDGRRTATFSSTWRLEADGRWRVVFDKGAAWCPPPEN